MEVRNEKLNGALTFVAGGLLKQDWLSFWFLNRGGGRAEISFIWGKWPRRNRNKFN